MAATTIATSLAMTDADFLLVNGAVAAGATFPASSPFYGVGDLTATTAAGTTTISLLAGRRNTRTAERLMILARRIVQTYPAITNTP